MRWIGAYCAEVENLMYFSKKKKISGLSSGVTTGGGAGSGGTEGAGGRVLPRGFSPGTFC